MGFLILSESLESKSEKQGYESELIKVMISGSNINTLNDSGKLQCGVYQSGVGSNCLLFLITGCMEGAVTFVVDLLRMLASSVSDIVTLHDPLMNIIVSQSW